MSKKRVVWMFSGQGSQYHGMGRELYEHDLVFRECLHRCDSIARRWLNGSLVEIMYHETRSSAFDDTRLTHLALCAVQYAMARTMRSRGHRPDLLLGYSLGEACARIISREVSLENALELLHAHATLMESTTPPGGMLAALEKPEVILPIADEITHLCLAAHNFENHCVFSGTLDAVDRLEQRLTAKQITLQRLPVRRAFHSPLMDAAEPEFRRHLASVTPGAPRFEVTSATSAQPISGLEGIWHATRDPVHFLRTIERLESQCPEGNIYLDLGPSGTLATFLKYIHIGPESAAYSILSPWGGALKKIQNFETHT
jgi:acyl transferase domain-containing protein